MERRYIEAVHEISSDLSTALLEFSDHIRTWHKPWRSVALDDGYILFWMSAPSSVPWQPDKLECLVWRAGESVEYAPNVDPNDQTSIDRFVAMCEVRGHQIAGLGTAIANTQTEDELEFGEFRVDWVRVGDSAYISCHLNGRIVESRVPIDPTSKANRKRARRLIFDILKDIRPVKLPRRSELKKQITVALIEFESASDAETGTILSAKFSDGISGEIDLRPEPRLYAVLRSIEHERRNLLNAFEKCRVDCEQRIPDAIAYLDNASSAFHNLLSVAEDLKKQCERSRGDLFYKNWPQFAEAKASLDDACGLLKYDTIGQSKALTHAYLQTQYSAPDIYYRDCWICVHIKDAVTQSVVSKFRDECRDNRWVIIAAKGIKVARKRMLDFRSQLESSGNLLPELESFATENKGR